MYPVGFCINIFYVFHMFIFSVLTYLYFLEAFLLMKTKCYRIDMYLACEQTQLLDHTSAASFHSLGCHDQDECD